jgi:hypothetical protein
MTQRKSRDKSTKTLNFDRLSEDAYITVTAAVDAGVAPGSKATTYRYIKQHRYPMPKKIGSNTSRLRVGDVREWAKDPAEYFRRADISNARGKK